MSLANPMRKIIKCQRWRRRTTRPGTYLSRLTLECGHIVIKPQSIAIKIKSCLCRECGDNNAKAAA